MNSPKHVAHQTQFSAVDFGDSQELDFGDAPDGLAAEFPPADSDSELAEYLEDWYTDFHGLDS